MCQVSYSKKTEYKSKDKFKNFKGSPKWAFIEITSKCSHKCSWCYGGFNSDDWSDEISVRDFKKLTKKLKDIGITQITLSGGEPTDHSQFEEILYLCEDFIVNITSHGDWKDPNIIDVFKRYNVNQVQFNYQGAKHHDNIHGVESYNKQIENIKKLKETGIDVVGSLTVGKYNLADTKNIFKELEDLGTDRLRVWETTGFGNAFRKDLETKEIFDVAGEEAKKLGYNYVQSYEPVVQGDVGIPCLAMSGMAMHINYKCEHIFCGAVPDQLDKPLSNMLDSSAKEILEAYNNFIQKNKEDKPFCMARRS